MERDDLYKTLQVTRDADAEVISAAYRRLAFKHHPDRNHGADTDAQMRRLNAAYAVLSDPAKRAAYDQQLARMERASTAPPTAAPAQTRTEPSSNAGPTSIDEPIESASRWRCFFCDQNRPEYGCELEVTMHLNDRSKAKRVILERFKVPRCRGCRIYHDRAKSVNVWACVSALTVGLALAICGLGLAAIVHEKGLIPNLISRNGPILGMIWFGLAIGSGWAVGAAAAEAVARGRRPAGSRPLDATDSHPRVKTLSANGWVLGIPSELNQTKKDWNHNEQ